MAVEEDATLAMYRIFSGMSFLGIIVVMVHFISTILTRGLNAKDGVIYIMLLLVYAVVWFVSSKNQQNIKKPDITERKE